MRRVINVEMEVPSGMSTLFDRLIEEVIEKDIHECISKGIDVDVQCHKYSDELIRVECPFCGVQFDTGSVGDRRGCWNCDKEFLTNMNIVRP